MQWNIRMRAAEHRDGEARGFAVRCRFEAPPDGKRIENEHTALHLQEAFNDAFGGVGLAPAFLGDDGNVGIERAIGNKTDMQLN